MHAVKAPSIVILVAISIATGCIPFGYSPSGGLHQNERDIEELLKASSTRNDVRTRLGNPAREYGNDMSYLGCFTPGGFGFVLLTPVGATGDTVVGGGAEECYEFVLHFDDDDRLQRFKKLPFYRHFTVPDSTLQKYFNDPRHSDAKKWLCRAAEEGDAQAQYRLALLYENGSEGLPQDYVMAYVWYRLAESNGDYMKAGDQATRIIDYLNAEQSMRAQRLLHEWEPGFCEKRIIPASESSLD